MYGNQSSIKNIVTQDDKVMPRARVDQLLSDAVDNSVVMLTAGTGHGKTRAVSSYLAKSNVRVVWQKLTRLDNYTVRFWKNFTAILQSWDEQLALRLSAMDFPESFPAFERFLQPFGEAVLREMKVVMVFDDFHLLNDSAVHEFIEQLIAADVEGLSIVLLSGAELQISTESCPGRRVVQLTDHQLRFTIEETAAYYTAQGIDLTDKQLEQIYKFTEGWALAVYLVGMNLNNGCSIEENPLQKAGAAIYALIEEEIYAHCSPRMQHAMLLLSLLYSFPLQIVPVLTGLTPKEALAMVETNHFIGYQPQNCAYYFHTLFLEFLERKRSVLTEEEKNALYHKAADWYVGKGLRLEALTYYGECGAYERMFEVIRYFCTRPISRALTNRCLRLLEQLPREYTSREPMVAVVRARMHYNNLEIETAGRMVDGLVAEYSVQNNTESVHVALGELYVLKTLLCMTAGDTGFDRWLRLAAEALPQGSSLISSDGLFLGDNNPLVLAGGETGMLQAAERAFSNASPYIERVFNGSGSGLEHLSAAETAYFCGDFYKAEQNAFRGIYKGMEREQWDIVCGGYYILERTSFGDGNYSATCDHLAQLKSHAEKIGECFTLPDIAQSWFALKCGNPEQVPRWISDHIADPDNPASLYLGRARVISAEYLLLLHKFPQLLALLEHYEELYQQKGQWFMRLKLQVIKSICYNLTGEYQQAAVQLQQAYEQSAGSKVIMPFVEYGNYTRALIERIYDNAGHHIPTSWLDLIHARASTFAKHQSLIRRQYNEEHKSGHSLLDTLSSRDREILGYLCDGMKREEIALRMGVSIHTVNASVRSVYTKLGAINRADAVRIAASGNIERSGA